MKKYHVATGDGKGYYGVGYESYRQAESLLKISQEHDPQAHIVEEEYHFTNADRIRAMSDEKLAELLVEEKEYGVCHIPFFRCPGGKDFDEDKYEDALQYTIDWLKQPAEE